MSSPTVSVIIPTYNRAAMLPRAIDSVLAQTFADWELVIVDDGSSDQTEQVLATYQEKLGEKLVVVRRPHLGCSAARNQGIKVCRGRFVAFLDSDDEFLPYKLEYQLELLTEHPELGFVYGDYGFVDLEGRRWSSALTTKFPAARNIPMRRVGSARYVVGPQLFDALLHSYFIATIVGMVRREALGQDIRFNERLSYAEEWLFYLQLARRGTAGFIDEPLALHHFTPNSLTRTDKARNIARQCLLFREMKKQFPDLTPPQRHTVNGHLARAHAQLAGCLRTAGRPIQALLCFAQASYYGWKLPNMAALWPRRHQVRELRAR